MFVDTHTHFYDEWLLPEADAAVERALAAGVDRMIQADVDSRERPAMWEVARRHPDCLFQMLGLYPGSVDKDWRREIDALEAWRGRGIVAVGEIGLDYHYGADFKEEQKEAFRVQLELAAAWGLPAPPEGVDLSGREFKLANAFNSITDQRPNHAYGAGVTVDEVSADAFNHFVTDAQAAGYGVTAWRGYIDYWTTLENYYEPAVFSYGAETASKTTFVPGCHDHQTALCIDLRYNGSEDFRGTEAWDWLISHCADYGIILRYPEGQESWYGTACMCPCHFRYVGVEPARYIMANNITLEQFMLLYDWDILYVPGVN